MKVHVIEPQALFASALDKVFDDLGLEVIRVSRDADFRELLDEQPALIFVDPDFTPQEPTRLIGLLRTLLPKSSIAVYTQQRSCQFARACCQVGANAVFSKAADREEIVDGLRQMFATGEYTDARLRE